MASELITKNSGLVLPEVPKDAQWDYTKSVGKVGSFVFKWKTLKAEVPEILDELWIAREKLSEQGGDRKSNQWNKSSTDKKTWTDYCQEIGSSRQAVNRWLARAGYLAIARQKNEAEAVEAVEKASTGEVVLNGEPPLVSPQEAVSASRDKSPMIRTLDSNPSKFFYQWDFCPIDLTFYPHVGQSCRR